LEDLASSPLSSSLSDGESEKKAASEPETNADNINSTAKTINSKIIPEEKPA
jgi:hypothetical protein